MSPDWDPVTFAATVHVILAITDDNYRCWRGRRTDLTADTPDGNARSLPHSAGSHRSGD